MTQLSIAKLSVQNHDFGSEVTVIPVSEACNNLAHLCSYVLHTPAVIENLLFISFSDSRHSG